ncbi:YybS family protein [Clostridium sp.]|uniref:YybS family protein n=1 Tax=Clostridium sp. TaxID=1506 RepID=UPI003D6D8FF1
MEEKMRNKNYSTKAIVEASLISVIILVIMIIIGYLPIVSVIGTLILPIPVAILYIRHNYKITIMAIVLSVILTSLVYNPVMAIYAAITCSIVGITLGYCIKSNKTSSITLLYLAISSAISKILTVAFFMLFIEKVSFMNFLNNKLDFFKQSMNGSLLELKAIYTQSGITPKQLEILDKNFDTIKGIDVNIFLVAIPAAIFIGALISAYLNYKVSSAVLNKLNYKMNEILPFRKFYVNNIVGAVLIGTVCIGIILSSKNIPGGNYILESSQFLVLCVFIINGLAASIYFLRVKRNLSKPIVVLIIVLTMLTKVSSVYFSIGLMEMAFDFRKLDPYRIKRK